MADFISNLLFVFQRLNWLSVLDILLVASIFFALLYSLRDTQAMALLRGVIFLFVLLAFFHPITTPPRGLFERLFPFFFRHKDDQP